jgi:ubiquinone/menaquinone biosynthesis C-methylase UbiE
MNKREVPVCDYEGSTYQRDFWDAGGREYEDQVEAVAIKRLMPKRGSRLLEVGAGAGRNTMRYTGFDQIVLLDYSRTQLEQAQARLGESERYIYVAADIYRLPFDSAVFDAATMIRTIHHLAEPRDALRNIHYSLAQGAMFVLEYANKQNFKAILRWATRQQEWNPFHRDTIEFAELNYDFHPEVIDKWLSETGFCIRRKLTVSHFRAGFLKRTVPLRILVGLDSVLQWTGNWWQLSPSVFVQSRVEGEPESVKGDLIWRCPSCSSVDLESSTGGLKCGNCSRVWPLRDGIYDFKGD